MSRIVEKGNARAITITTHVHLRVSQVRLLSVHAAIHMRCRVSGRPSLAVSLRRARINRSAGGQPDGTVRETGNKCKMPKQERYGNAFSLRVWLTWTCGVCVGN